MEGQNPPIFKTKDPKVKANFVFQAFIELELRPALERFLLFHSKFTLSPDDIQDLVQDTLLEYVRSPDRVPMHKAIAWCRVVARNRFTDRYRQTRNRKMLPIEDNLPAKTTEVDVLLNKALYEAFAHLTEHEQYAIYAKANGATHVDIATHLGIDLKDSHYLVRKAKEKLQADKKLSDIFEKGYKL